MKCTNCGAEIANGAQFCQVCGSNQPSSPQPQQQGYQQPMQQTYSQQPEQQSFQQPYTQQQVSNADASTGMKVLSVIIPVVGIILWAMKRNTEPVAAKSLLMCGIAGVATWFILEILL